MSRLLNAVAGSGVIVLVGLFASTGHLFPAQLTQARVTSVIGDMRLLPEQGIPRPASVNDDVRHGTQVHMGTRARGELIFADQALARLGADTIFSLKDGADIMELGRGVMLLEVPKGVDGHKIKAGVAVSAISGTVMVKYDSNYLTLIVLQGKALLSLEGAPLKVVVLRSGQRSVNRLRPQPAELGDPAEIDLGHLMETSLLVRGFRRLASQDLIDKQMRRQSEDKATGELVSVSMPADMLVNNLTTVDQATTARSQSITQKPQSELVLPPPIPSPAPPPPTGMSPSPAPTPTGAVSFKKTKTRIAPDGSSLGTVALPNRGRGIRTNISEAVQTDRRLMHLRHRGRGR
jgi:hypothetical protein